MRSDGRIVPEGLFGRLCNEEVRLQNANGDVSGPFRCVITAKGIQIFAESLDVSEGDKAMRALPNGRIETYRVLDVRFTNRLELVPAFYFLTTEREGSLLPKPGSAGTNITISNSHGFQIGDHNVQNIVTSFELLIDAINKSPIPEAKTEAKSRLKSLLEHPLVATALGEAVKGLIAQVSG